MNRIMIRLMLIGISAGLCGRADAGTYGEVHLYGTGLDANFHSDDTYATKVFTYDTTKYTLLAPNTLTSYFPVLPPNPDGTYNIGSLTSSAVMKNDYGTLGLSYTMNVIGSPAPINTEPAGNAMVIHRDEIELKWTRGGIEPLLPSHQLDATWSVDGTFSLNTSNGTTQGSLSLYAGLESNYLTYQYDKSSFLNPNDHTLDITLAPTVRFSLGLDGKAVFSPALAVSVLPASYDSTLGVTADHSMKLTSITFPDGTTPESHGWAVVFASGAPSPNVSSVPEPSGLILGGIAAAALVAAVRRGQNAGRRSRSRKGK